MTHHREVRRPWFLATITWAYLGWSLLPLAAAVGASLGTGPLGDGGLSLDAYRSAFADSEIRAAFLQSTLLAVATVAVAVPLGGALGLGLAHLQGRRWRGVRATLIAAIALPHAVFGIVLMYLVLFASPFHLDTPAQLVGHVTLAIPFVALIVWIRMRLLDATVEEQAADLGAPPASIVVRVLVPLSVPALVVAATVAFAISFNELPLSRYLCTPNECRTVPMLLGGRALGDVPPSEVAIGVVATLISLAILGILLVGVVGTRRVARRR
jgi:spermidine/putrescine transport system permease protein